ncbi:hypothetical protein OF001_U40021 [Pseudomonas sp. OF001]|nr:hypothetical protein OF001_U40021 [Pseudomonas sp. OF001]
MPGAGLPRQTAGAGKDRNRPGMPYSKAAHAR